MRQTAHHRNGLTRGADWRGCCSQKKDKLLRINAHCLSSFSPCSSSDHRLSLERGRDRQPFDAAAAHSLEARGLAVCKCGRRGIYSVELLVGWFVSPRLYVRPTCLAHSCGIPFLVSDLHGSDPRFPFPPITSQSPASI